MKDEAKHEHHKKNNDASTNDASRAETVTDAIAKQPTDSNVDTQAAPAVKKTNETNSLADRAVDQAQAETPTPNPFEGSANQAQATQTATPVMPVVAAGQSQQQNTAQPMGQAYYMTMTPNGPMPIMAMAQQPDKGKDFNGLRGWLAFFMILLGLIGLGCLALFIDGLSALVVSSLDTASMITTILAPVVAIASLVAAVFIALRKRTGKMLAIVAIILMAITTVAVGIVSIVDDLSYDSSSHSSSYYYYDDDITINTRRSSSRQNYQLVQNIGSIVLSLVVYTLMGLYFQKSRRVEQTLIE